MHKISIKKIIWQHLFGEMTFFTSTHFCLKSVLVCIVWKCLICLHRLEFYDLCHQFSTFWSMPAVLNILVCANRFLILCSLPSVLICFCSTQSWIFWFVLPIMSSMPCANNICFFIICYKFWILCFCDTSFECFSLFQQFWLFWSMVTVLKLLVFPTNLEFLVYANSLKCLWSVLPVFNILVGTSNHESFALCYYIEFWGLYYQFGIVFGLCKKRVFNFLFCAKCLDFFFFFLPLPQYLIF